MKTYALLAGSDAIDQADIATATTTDQRGYSAFNGRDIGARESADQDSDKLGSVQLPNSFKHCEYPRGSPFVPNFQFSLTTNLGGELGGTSYREFGSNGVCPC